MATERAYEVTVYDVDKHHISPFNRLRPSVTSVLLLTSSCVATVLSLWENFELETLLQQRFTSLFLVVRYSVFSVVSR